MLPLRTIPRRLVAALLAAVPSESLLAWLFVVAVSSAMASTLLLLTLVEGVLLGVLLQRAIARRQLRMAIAAAAFYGGHWVMTNNTFTGMACTCAPGSGCSSCPS